jgi:hypothetical protein
VEPLPDCNFVMTTNHLWEPNLKKSLNEKMLDQAENEQPLSVYIFDMPDQHKYINDNADNFLEALADTKYEQIYIFENISVRAIIEMKWPLIRKAIIKKLFIPYLVFLMTFLLYSVYIFENLNPHPEYIPEVDSVINHTNHIPPGNASQSLYTNHP